LRLLACAVSGRSLQVDAAAGPVPWTDGETIHLPAGIDRRTAVGMVAVQASLAGAGSLRHDVVRSCARRAALARRYLFVEGHRALATSEPWLPTAVRALVDHDVVATTDSPETSLAIARSSVPLADPPPWFGALEPRRVLAAKPPVGDHAGGQPPSSSAPPPSTRERPDLDEDPDGYDLGDLLSSPVGGGGPLGRLLVRLFASTQGRGTGGPPGADAAHVSTLRPGVGRRPAVTSAAGTALDPVAAPELGGATYPEWDVRRGRYRAAWCTVAEAAPRADGAELVSDSGAALRRPLARLGVGRLPTCRQRHGGDIDVDAAIEARVDHLAGLPHEDTVYVESLRRRRDLAVLVLLDVSGSAGEPGTGGRPVHEHQRAVAAALTSAVHDLGDRVALYGFRSRGRSAVQLLRVKAFDDHLDGQVRRRLGGLTPGAYTRLGAAIRHGTAVLEARAGTPRRLLVVLSDGFAYDHGYEGRYGEADARRALVEARQRGVGCLCLSVGADADPVALRRVFGPAAHATVPQPEELPGLIGPLFRAALRSAEAQQRVHQRKERARRRLEGSSR
jgi:hypothetical protein